MPVDFAALAEPFPIGEIEFRAGAVSGNRALALGYIDARVVMDRLDAVVGPANWRDTYCPLPSGCVECTLSIRVDSEWIPKTDVGGPSDQKDVGDHTKAAYSDALKRAAVKWGLGRYLYSLPAVWVDYDPGKKQLVKAPTLPAWAMPKAKEADKPAIVVPDKPANKPAPLPDMHPAVVGVVRFVASEPTIKRVNEYFMDEVFPLPDGPIRRQSWEVLKGYAKNQGWGFDKPANQFVNAPEPVKP